MAAGMNWGILTLLAMIVVVLGGVAGFFIFLARRSTGLATNSEAAAAELAQSWSAHWPTQNEPSAMPDEPLPRGGLKRVSVLAQQRKHCVHGRSMPGASISRGRN
jgi:hypothetical protein